MRRRRPGCPTCAAPPPSRCLRPCTTAGPASGGRGRWVGAGCERAAGQPPAGPADGRTVCSCPLPPGARAPHRRNVQRHAAAEAGALCRVQVQAPQGLAAAHDRAPVGGVPLDAQVQPVEGARACAGCKLRQASRWGGARWVRAVLLAGGRSRLPFPGGTPNSAAHTCREDARHHRVRQRLERRREAQAARDLCVRKV